jgi:hypothetical protein
MHVSPDPWDAEEREMRGGPCYPGAMTAPPVRQPDCDDLGLCRLLRFEPQWGTCPKHRGWCSTMTDTERRANLDSALHDLFGW